MLQPGSKNWINMYLHLVEEGKINTDVNVPSNITKDSFLHTTLFRSGIVFGYPSHFLFSEDKLKKEWTADERLKILLFESLYFVYRVEQEKPMDQEFISTLHEFYAKYHDRSSLNVLKLLFKESTEVQVENILNRRVHIKRTLKNQFWVNYLNNSLVFLDVLAFHDFLILDRKFVDSYDRFLSATLYTVGAASLADGTIDAPEQTLIDVFISSANADTSLTEKFKRKLNSKDIGISDIELPKECSWLFKLFLTDMAVLTVHSDLTALDDEMVFLYELCTYFNIDTEQLHNALMLIERFVIENNHKVNFLSEQSSYEELYSNFSKRWIKILGRNKDKFIEELRESKELISLVNKSITEELSAEEKEKVKNQFRDLAKSMPAIAIFMLPGGMLLLPIILKIVPNLIPSAFKSNEIDKSDSDKKSNLPET